MKAISAVEFMKLEGLKRDYIIPGLVPEVGRVALYGVAKRGKSFLALQLALSVCQGLPFLGYPVVKSGPVLYLQFDTPPEIWQDRLLKLQNKHKVTIPANLHTINPFTQPRRVNILHGHQAKEIYDMIMATLPVLVILDVLSKVHQLNENESKDMKPIVEQITTLCAGRAVLIVHHTAKPNLQPGAGQQSASTAGRGSSYLGGEVDANWLLISRGEGRASFAIESRFAAQVDDMTLFQRESGLWEPSSQTSLTGRPPDALDTALVLLKDHPELDTYSKAMKRALELGISPRTFARAWKRLRAPEVCPK